MKGRLGALRPSLLGYTVLLVIEKRRIELSLGVFLSWIQVHMSRGAMPVILRETDDLESYDGEESFDNG
jgi:hypothetical protein